MLHKIHPVFIRSIFSLVTTFLLPENNHNYMYIIAQSNISNTKLYVNMTFQLFYLGIIAFCESFLQNPQYH